MSSPGPDRPRRILVTGGAGFVGSHYVRSMLAGDYPGYAHAEITVLDKLSYAGNLANLDLVAQHPRLRFVAGDMRWYAGHRDWWQPLTADRLAAGR